LGSAIVQGKPFSIISIPIELYDSKAVLERTANSLAYHPVFLEDKGNKDVLEQMEGVIGAWMGSFMLSTGQRMPFESVGGETLQCSLGDSDVYLE